jgi:leucyl aminopeptidase
MNLFYNVGKSASSEPRCVTVLYKGNPASDEVEMAFVGKGLTFDTGGLNLKPTGAIEDMYYDKAGACAVMGALKGAMELGIKKNVVFAMGFAENSIDSNSYKPLDIIKSMKGITVEIGNTDAEGRLVLADTFTFVQREYKPKKLVDLATLTGAIMVALGQETAGLFSNDDDFAQEIKESGKEVFEAMWHMPITNEAKEAIKGSTADISNSGKSRWGGSSKAAAFLERFIEKGVKWVHLDIAGAGQ